MGKNVYPKRELMKRGNVEEHYEFLGKLEDGTFGVVWLATHRKSRKKRAIKVVTEDEDAGNDWTTIENETDILQQVSHRNILHLLEYFDTNHTRSLVTEFYRGKSLFDEFKERGIFSEADSALVARQLLSAVAYLRRKGIIHRDIKPENVMLRRPGSLSSIKLIDFGSAVHCTPDGLKGKAGSPNYMAPEVVHKGDYNHKCDIWAIGIVTYILLFGKQPFDGEDPHEIFYQVKYKEDIISDKDQQAGSQKATDFVSALLTRDVERRPEAAAALKHSFVARSAWKHWFNCRINFITRRFKKKDKTKATANKEKDKKNLIQ